MTGPYDHLHQRWGTFRRDRRVLAVGRTYTSTVRLLEALPLLLGDPRIGVDWTLDPGSAFGGDARTLLARHGVTPLPWSDMPTTEPYDLALTASENVDLDRINAKKTIVQSHGIGFHKHVPDSGGTGDRLSGVVPGRHLREREVTMLISHPGQRDQLARTHPEAAARCVVAGDLAFDRLTGSLPRRDDYRSLLGVPDGRRLVVVTSTWRGGSLLGHDPALPARLLRSLPYDAYAVALVAHPNIRAWEQGSGLEPLLPPGLALIPPDAGWQAALVAADLVIGDHGSVTLYAAALDRPLLLTDARPADLVPGTPPEDLAREAPRLDPATPLLPQVEAAILGHRPGRHDALRDRMFAHRGRAAAVLRALLYDALGLSEPGHPADLAAADDPEPPPTAPGSFEVFASVGRDGDVTLTRFPVTSQHYDPAPAPGRHLCSTDGERGLLLPRSASVIARRRPGGSLAWTAAALRGSQAVVATAATGRGCVAETRDGRRFEVTAPGADPALVGSALYARLRDGTLRPGILRVTAAPTGTTLHLTPARPAAP
jgi:hypothetical protein